jgi:tetratricopeptide (TPR) repeat protein
MVLVAAALSTTARLPAQEVGGASPDKVDAAGGLVYQRKVQLSQGPAPPSIVITEFFTHGELDPRGASLSVQDGRRNPVPWRLLQVGPGDFCRLAFQTVPRQSLYRIHYGGTAAPGQPPAWTSKDGLLLETRRWRDCDLRSLVSVLRALETSEPYGGGFVPSVFHRFNPFRPEPEPFLSDYRGWLRIPASGHYRFFTSSQDCSFLLIDGRTVVSAPGRHGPAHNARFKGEIDLQPGLHEFRYVHAAAGPDACMVAAWQPPGSVKPEAIPAEAFGSGAIARLPATGVRHLHEFAAEIAGEVPLADSPAPLLRAQFRHVSARGSTTRPKVHWDFGDGQTSTQTDPVHVFLQPGLYKVTMKLAGEAESLACVDRVPIHRALMFADAEHPADTLAMYLSILDKYDPARLDPGGLLQLVRAFDQAGLTSRAVEAGEAWVQKDREPTEAEDALTAARMVGSLLRDRLDEPERAARFWQSAIKVLRPESWKAECEVEAADVALNMLLKEPEARALLDSASARLGRGGDAALRCRMDRVLGDWHARKGDAASARAAYARAMASSPVRRSAVEQDAWRGALSRSTEEFLRTGDLDRAWAELRRWQEEYPIDKAEGYLTLLLARYWAARARWPRAIPLASDLVTINPDSPYADRLVFLAAGGEAELGHADRARAGFESLLRNYPGSPLVGEARRKLAVPPGKRP